MLSAATVREIEAKINYTFVNKGLLIQAFTRRSFSNEEEQAGREVMQCNEVLEFCGDSILGAVIVSTLLARNGDMTAGYLKTALSEGAFSTVKSRMSDKSMLSERMTHLGLHRYLLLSNGDRERGIADEPSVKEDLFESIVGAVFLDSGGDFARVSDVVCGMLDIDAYLTERASVKNEKNRLQEYCQARKIPFSYETLGMSGPEHDPTYTVSLAVGGKALAVGSGRNVKKAEMAAAREALLLLEGGTTVDNPQDEKQPRTVLKEWADKTRASVAYTSCESDGDSLDARFTAICTVNGKTLGKGVGGSKREAMARAATEALDKLNIKE